MEVDFFLVKQNEIYVHNKSEIKFKNRNLSNKYVFVANTNAIYYMEIFLKGLEEVKRFFSLQKNCLCSKSCIVDVYI